MKVFNLSIAIASTAALLIGARALPGEQVFAVVAPHSQAASFATLQTLTPLYLPPDRGHPDNTRGAGTRV